MMIKSPYRRLLLPLFAISLFLLQGAVVFADSTVSREIALGKSGDRLQSPVVHLEQSFNSVILKLDHFAKDLEVSFNPLDEGAWEPVITHDDGFGSSFLLFTSPTRSIQFKKRPEGNESSLSFSAEFFFVDAPVAMRDTLLVGPQTTSDFRVIPRSEWGADESFRYWTPETLAQSASNTNERDSGNVDPCGDYATKYRDEVAIDRTISTSPSGDLLVWPLAYSKKERKIVIHHTDSEVRDLNGDFKTDTQDFAAMMRAIYRFHTFTRGWGDIGYNYVIDPLGNIYEGRFGGDRVIAAHAQCFNNGSLGISVIGDYQNTSVPEPALNSLIRLVSQKAQQYGIDPQANSIFRGKDLPNILGHRDVRPTSCPGDKLYAALPKIRERAGFSVRSGTFNDTAPSAQPLDYNAEPLSAVSTLSLLPNQRKEIVLRFKNTGNKAWDGNTWLHVALNDRESARVVPLIPDKTFVAADLQENMVSPGDTGTFKVEFESGYFAANADFQLAPVVNGRYKVSRAAMTIPVQVQTPQFSYAVVKTSLPTGTVFQGQKIEASIQLQNTGNTRWVNYGAHAIRLGTEGVRDHRSALSPKSPTRLAHLVQSEVAPGEVGTFVFDLEVPIKLQGQVRERFTPVIERVSWLEDKGLGFNVMVKKPIHMARISEKTELATLMPGEMRKIQMTLENRGDLVWDADTMKIGLLAKELKVFKSDIIPQNPIPPRSSATFDFWVQAPYREVDGSVFLNSKFRKIQIRGGTARFLIHVPAPRLRAQKTDQTSATVSLRPGEEKEIMVRFKNLGNAVWRSKGPNAVALGTSQPKDRASSLYLSSSWANKSRAGHLVEAEVKPGEVGTFLFKIKPKIRGTFRETFQLVMEQVGWIEGGMATWNFNVSGDKVAGAIDSLSDARDNKVNAAVISKVKSTTPVVSGNTSTLQEPALSAVVAEKSFRVRLSYGADEAKLTSNRNFKVVGKSGETLFDLKPGAVAEVRHVNDNFHVQVGSDVRNSSVIRFIPTEGGVMEIRTMERRPAWNNTLNDNQFRGTLEIRAVNGAAAYINELPLEDYMRGLAEVSNDTPFEKQKAIAVLARTYARFYMDDAHRKFPGLPYDGSDDPAIFQRYLGYGVELRSPNFSSAVLATKDRVVTYNGKLIKTPYFNQSSGKTLSALEVWGWKDTPYLQSVSDPYCEGLKQNGHGVGLSGCGAEGMAKAGKTYDAIIHYYYQGVEIEEMKF